MPTERIFRVALTRPEHWIRRINSASTEIWAGAFRWFIKTGLRSPRLSTQAKFVRIYSAMNRSV